MLTVTFLRSSPQDTCMWMFLLCAAGTVAGKGDKWWPGHKAKKEDIVRVVPKSWKGCAARSVCCPWEFLWEDSGRSYGIYWRRSGRACSNSHCAWGIGHTWAFSHGTGQAGTVQGGSGKWGMHFGHICLAWSVISSYPGCPGSVSGQSMLNSV